MAQAPKAGRVAPRRGALTARWRGVMLGPPNEALLPALATDVVSSRRSHTATIMGCCSRAPRR
jgi:hypothetical protein